MYAVDRTKVDGCGATLKGNLISELTRSTNQLYSSTGIIRYGKQAGLESQESELVAFSKIFLTRGFWSDRTHLSYALSRWRDPFGSSSSVETDVTKAPDLISLLIWRKE